MNYTISPSNDKPVLINDWNHSSWQTVSPLAIANFRKESSEHRPDVQLKLQYTSDSLYGLFKVEDQYVRCISTELQTGVCLDSCVEAFICPKPGKGYFNFEFNCGGNVLCYYVEDATRCESGFKKFEKLTIPELQQVEIYHSLPSTVEPEITEPTQWFLGFRVPFSLFETYTGELTIEKGQPWKANFYKCGDKTSHPHWASWNPVSELNFHLPACFGSLELG